MIGVNTILILIIMSIGILIGYKFFPEKLHKPNSYFQILCTSVSIFSMGVSLGSRENILEELKTLGFQSLTFSIVPIIFSILIVYPLTKKFMEGKKNDGNNSDN